jgi:hypothetical protein
MKTNFPKMDFFFKLNVLKMSEITEEITIFDVLDEDVVLVNSRKYLEISGNTS